MNYYILIKKSGKEIRKIKMNKNKKNYKSLNIKINYIYFQNF